MPKGGRTKGAKDKKPRTMNPASLRALEDARTPGCGLPSRVVRTHGEERTLRWWAGLDPSERAKWLEFLFQNRQNIHLTDVTADYAD